MALRCCLYLGGGLVQFAAIGKKAELPMGSCFSRISAATFGRCFLNSWEAALRRLRWSCVRCY